jgi:hypothetical protein
MSAEAEMYSDAQSLASRATVICPHMTAAVDKGHGEKSNQSNAGTCGAVTLDMLTACRRVGNPVISLPMRADVAAVAFGITVHHLLCLSHCAQAEGFAKMV